MQRADADRCILEHFLRVRDRTIELVERVPDVVLQRTPEGEASTLIWQFVHIADGPDWWMTHILKDGGSWAWPPPYPPTKPGLVAGLSSSRDRVVCFFADEQQDNMGRIFYGLQPDEEWSGRDRVLYLTDHEIHHRGRIVLALMQFGFGAFPGEAGEQLWPAAAGSS